MGIGNWAWGMGHGGASAVVRQRGLGGSSPNPKGGPKPPIPTPCGRGGPESPMSDCRKGFPTAFATGVMGK
ncbi:hypothetical protein NIES4103_28630 [Nostoc sp. NIES-4103]|nr:hypothetical protein NIES4103_28630 [Nostoc sp. NIES-4103]